MRTQLKRRQDIVILASVAAGWPGSPADARLRQVQPESRAIRENDELTFVA
jgi:hypothetical protein